MLFFLNQPSRQLFRAAMLTSKFLIAINEKQNTRRLTVHKPPLPNVPQNKCFQSPPGNVKFSRTQKKIQMFKFTVKDVST